jgi:hypothetical protein
VVSARQRQPVCMCIAGSCVFVSPRAHDDSAPAFLVRGGARTVTVVVDIVLEETQDCAPGRVTRLPMRDSPSRA